MRKQAVNIQQEAKSKIPQAEWLSGDHQARQVVSMFEASIAEMRPPCVKAVTAEGVMFAEGQDDGEIRALYGVCTRCRTGWVQECPPLEDLDGKSLKTAQVAQLLSLWADRYAGHDPYIRDDRLVMRIDYPLEELVDCEDVAGLILRAEACHVALARAIMELEAGHSVHSALSGAEEFRDGVLDAYGTTVGRR